jgi:hypothetical protein
MWPLVGVWITEQSRLQLKLERYVHEMSNSSTFAPPNWLIWASKPSSAITGIERAIRIGIGALLVVILIATGVATFVMQTAGLLGLATAAGAGVVLTLTRCSKLGAFSGLVAVLALNVLLWGGNEPWSFVVAAVLGALSALGRLLDQWSKWI